MNRKAEINDLLLLSAFLFGVIIRFYPALANGFPLNDGGMFYSMAQDLRTNGFALPAYTHYNQIGIPFAYPPFGFYIAALLSTFTPGSDLWVFLYVPALINSLSIAAFYLFSKEITQSRSAAAVSTLFYALLDGFFMWQVMGGGITRAFGFLFELLALWQAYRLFAHQKQNALLPAILFGAGAVTSHPQTALHTAMGCLFLFLIFGRTKRGVVQAVCLGLGVAMLTAPWWAVVLSNHGVQPFLSAGGSSPRTLSSYLGVLSFNSFEEWVTLPLIFLGVMGLRNHAQSLKGKIFLIVWSIVGLIIDPRGASGMLLLSAVILSGWGVVYVSAWIHPRQGDQAETAVKSRMGGGILLGVSILLLLSSVISDFRLVNTSLKAADLEMITWVNENIAAGHSFALATGREYSMSDPLQEWFPALTQQKSLMTMQGLEWSAGENFFPYYSQTSAFQACGDVACLASWVDRNEAYDYLAVLRPEETASDLASVNLRNLGNSVRASPDYVLIYESSHFLIFEYLH